MIIEPVSLMYINAWMSICRELLTHLDSMAFILAVARTGNSSAARMAMMAMTTSNSINVKPWRLADAAFFITSLICAFIILAFNKRDCNRADYWYMMKNSAALVVLTPLVMDRLATPLALNAFVETRVHCANGNDRLVLSNST